MSFYACFINGNAGSAGVIPSMRLSQFFNSKEAGYVVISHCFFHSDATSILEWTAIRSQPCDIRDGCKVLDYLNSAGKGVWLSSHCKGRGSKLDIWERGSCGESCAGNASHVFLISLQHKASVHLILLLISTLGA